MSDRYIHGKDRVSYEERLTGVKKIFGDVAGRYDLMNDLMSLGLHRLWKRTFVGQVGLTPGMSILDLAGGTGDISFGLWKKAQEMDPKPTFHVVDLSYEMISQGRDRSWDEQCQEGITWTQANGEQLPLPDQSFDRVTMSFGLRNVPDIDKVLGEISRVLKPGGRVLIMEFSKPIEGVGSLVRSYNRTVLPFLGELIAGNKAAYSYLSDSIETFPDQETLAEKMRQAGLKRVAYENLSGGIVAIHQGTKKGEL